MIFCLLTILIWLGSILYKHCLILYCFREHVTPTRKGRKPNPLKNMHPSQITIGSITTVKKEPGHQGLYFLRK